MIRPTVGFTMNEDKPVVITESCLAVLVASCLETPSKETGGFLIGREEENRLIYGQRMDCLRLDTAYPVQTKKSGRGYWKLGNLRAYNRIIDAIKSMGFDLVGEYHSHIDNSAELSDDDKKFIEIEYRRLESKGIEISNWVEMVLNVNEKKYERRQARNYSCSPLKNRIKIITKGVRDLYMGYSITIATYWFDRENHAFPEAKVFLP